MDDLIYKKKSADEYEVWHLGVLIGYVRRDPRRRHLAASKTNWQCRERVGDEWFGAFETRKQAARYL